METARILGLEWHRWLFFFCAWLPWILIEVWYFFRMKKRFQDRRGEGDRMGKSDDEL